MLNRGIEAARGEYFAQMDCDDISLPHRLKKQVDFLNTHPNHGATIVKSVLIDPAIKYDVKRLLKKILVLFGKGISVLIPLHNKSSIFFFFPFFHIGGAEKVHTDIVECVSDKKPWIFITNKSKNNKLKPLFDKNGETKNAFIFTQKRIIRHIYTGVLAKKINKHKKAIVFGCNSIFFYDLISHLNDDILKIDLIHAFGGGIEHKAINFVRKVDRRVVSNKKAFYDLKRQSVLYGIEPGYIERIKLIDNRVTIPTSLPLKNNLKIPLKVLYVGRGSKEKRVHLIARAARVCNKRNIPTEFIFVGDVINSVEKHNWQYCHFTGEIKSNKLREIYEKADILIITSIREGFPISIMESMAYGVVPLSTAVGGIPYYINDKENGILITEENEDEIVNSIANNVEKLAKNREFLKKLSYNAFEFARKTFSSKRFCKEYRTILLEERLFKLRK